MAGDISDPDGRIPQEGYDDDVAGDASPDEHEAEFDAMLSYLRGLARPCEPPIGVGQFMVLFASAYEIGVWYMPVREGQREGEITISSARLAKAWAALRAGGALDMVALERFGGGPAGGRWLLGLLAQLPGVVFRERLELAPDSSDARLTWALIWDADVAHAGAVPATSQTMLSTIRHMEEHGRG